MQNKAEVEVARPVTGMDSLRWWLSGGVSAVYSGFLLLGWLLGPALGQAALGHVPWSFLLGTGVLCTVVTVMGAYVLVSNRHEVL